MYLERYPNFCFISEPKPNFILIITGYPLDVILSGHISHVFLAFVLVFPRVVHMNAIN